MIPCFVASPITAYQCFSFSPHLEPSVAVSLHDYEKNNTKVSHNIGYTALFSSMFTTDYLCIKQVLIITIRGKTYWYKAKGPKKAGATTLNVSESKEKELERRNVYDKSKSVSNPSKLKSIY